MRTHVAALLGLLGALTSLHCRRAPVESEVAAPLTSASAESVGDAPIVIRGAQVFDGQRSIGVVTVVLRGGLIEAVGGKVELPADAIEIDGRGHTLLPGLIDAHTHIWQRRHLEQALWFGVTTELDMMSAPAGLALLRKRQERGKNDDLADFRSAGFALTVAGGHGTEYGVEVPTVAGPEQVPAFVGERFEEGSDYLKIIYDDMATFGHASPVLSKESLTAGVAAAHRASRLAVVHITTEAQALDAVVAGADGLAHIFVDAAPSEELLRRVGQRDLFVADTLAVIQALCDGGEASARLAADPRVRPYLPPSELRTLTRGVVSTGERRVSCEPAFAALRALHGGGVTILASTDAPNAGTVHGASLHQDLALLVDAGLSPAEALTAASAAPARVFGLEDRGRIVAGMRADLLLVRGDPLADIEVTRDIARVWKGGVELDRRAVLQQIAEEVAAIDRARSAPPPAGSNSGEIANFDGGEVQALFGAGVQPSTDAMIGGASTVSLRVVSGGAEGSSQALEIGGKIDAETLPRAWAGAIFFPGAEPMATANLSRWRTLSFSARGDVQSMQVMLFTAQGGLMPSVLEVEIGAKWRRHELAFADFGVEPYDVKAIFFGLPASPGAATILIDELRLDAPLREP